MEILNGFTTVRRKKYKYYLDWNGGSMLADTLKELCERANEKFYYLKIPLPDKLPCSAEELWVYNNFSFDPDYHRNNTFRRYSGYIGYFVGYRASEVFGEEWNFEEYQYRLGRFEI